VVCGAVEAIVVVVVGGIGDSVGVVIDVETAVGIDIADSELGSDFGGSEESVEVVERRGGGAGTLLVVSGLSLSPPEESLSAPPGVGLVVDEGSSGFMSLLLGIACSLD
jgi:hypothetical protein